MNVTREPKYDGYTDLGSPDEPGEDYYLLVDGRRIGGTYWCGSDLVNDGERWASWGPAGYSMGHPDRESAEQAQVREYAINPDVIDRINEQADAVRAAEIAEQEAAAARRAEDRRRTRCDNEDSPGELIASVPACHALYADYAEVRQVADWLDAHGLHVVSAVHEIRIERRADRQVIVYEAGLLGGTTETRATTLTVAPPAIASPARLDLQPILDLHQQVRFPLVRLWNLHAGIRIGHRSCPVALRDRHGRNQRLTDATQPHHQPHRGRKSTRPDQETHTMNNTPEGTFDYDVTEGGVLVYFGPEYGLDLTSASDNPLRQLANIQRVLSLLQGIVANPDARELLHLVDDAAEPSTLPPLHPIWSLLEGLTEHAPAILADLRKLAAEIGEPCGVCGGDGGQEIGHGPIGWADCGACSGTRVQAAAA